MDEKELIELSDELVNAITKLVLGEKPGFLSGTIFKKLATHPRFMEMKQLYCDLLLSFDGNYSDAAELKKLTDFRYNLVELYQSIPF
jgi:hypothetical protein